MKRRTKLLAGLTACVAAFSLACVGFSAWSTDINLGGSVSANSNWDVEITDASLEVSTGATAANVEATVEVTVYDVVLGNGNNVNYYMVIDDENAKTITMTAEEFAEYGVRYTTLKGYDRYHTSGSKADKVLYYVNLNDAGDAVVSLNASGTAVSSSTGTVSVATATAAGYAEGTVVGQAIAASIDGSYSGTPTNNPNITLTWKTASDALEAAASEELQVRYTATTATYGTVNFSLSNAWANYSVTVKNNGTVNANLSDYEFDISELDESIYSVSMPSDFDSEVLAPGESCTFNFVVALKDTGTSISAEASNFSVTLKYVQDTVEEAPTATHSHNSNE